MEMSGERTIAAPRGEVWRALNDPEVLKASIPGCEELEREGDSGFAAKVRAKVGPVNARFSGKVNIVDPDPPNGYRIEGEGTGGAAGFAKGGADVRLKEDNGETILTYEANASVGGKLAQIGSRLVQGTARKMADDFFAKFSEIVAERAGKAPEAAEAVPAEAEAEEEKHTFVERVEETVEHAAEDVAETADRATKGIPQWMWILVAAVIIVGLVIFLS